MGLGERELVGIVFTVVATVIALVVIAWCCCRSHRQSNYKGRYHRQSTRGSATHGGDWPRASTIYGNPPIAASTMGDMTRSPRGGTTMGSNPRSSRGGTTMGSNPRYSRGGTTMGSIPRGGTTMGDMPRGTYTRSHSYDRRTYSSRTYDRRSRFGVPFVDMISPNHNRSAAHTRDLESGLGSTRRGSY
jgi:hypothetical protein